MPARRTQKIVNLVPYPHNLKLSGGGGKLIIRSLPKIELSQASEDKEKLSAELVLESLGGLPRRRRATRIRIGSLTTIVDRRGWLDSDGYEFLKTVKSNQGYTLRVTKGGITIVGKTPIGSLYGAQTLIQLIEMKEKKCTLPLLEIRDFPAVENRFLAIPMSWYAGYGRVGFASQLWDWDQWKWFLDWCVHHKINGINLCIYGYYPFRFEEYPEAVFKDVEMRTWIREIGREVSIRYTHPNVQAEFLPKMIRYANERGIAVLCYFGLNTFNGGYSLAHPESRYFSDNPDKFHQFKYNLCPSRPDVRRYLDASARKLLSFGFNGMVLEESEGSGFCECEACKTTYYDKDMDSRKALHKADYELFNRLYKLIRTERPDAVIGVRMWRMGSEMGVDYLRENKAKIPPDTLVFWSNGIDYEKFKGWIEVFGPARIMGQDAELLGFSTLYDGLVFMLPQQYSGYVRYVDRKFKPSYPQSLPNDIRQYKQAARYGCGGVTGYAFNWNGWEIAPLSLAQFGWNPDAFTTEAFLGHGYSHLYGEKSGPLVARAATELPIVLETRICEGSAAVPREDPVSGGLAGLTSLQVPTSFGEGDGQVNALRSDLRRARRALALLGRASTLEFEPKNHISLRYLENAAKRTVCICKAGIEYRKALEQERLDKPPKDRVVSHLLKSLNWVEADYAIVRENAFDLTEEFRERIFDALATIRNRLDRWENSSSQKSPVL